MNLRRSHDLPMPELPDLHLGKLTICAFDYLPMETQSFLFSSSLHFIKFNSVSWNKSEWSEYKLKLLLLPSRSRELLQAQSANEIQIDPIE